MKASMILAAAVAVLACTVNTVAAALPTAAAASSSQPDAAASSTVGRRLAAKPVRLTVVNQSPQAIHTDPQDGWEGDMQPGESKDFHAWREAGGSSKTVIITNYPAPQGGGVSCTVTAFNPSIGKPDMWASCYFGRETLVKGWEYSNVDAGTCGYVQESAGQHVYGHFCRENDSDDGYKHFTYYVYGN